MSKFKFYGIHDKTKEAIKVFSSKTLIEAYVIASKIKRLSVKTFKKLFKIEKIK
mgnify:FL=1